MASAESIAIRCDRALATLEAELTRLGVKVTPIPRLNRDKFMLRAIQLEALVEYVQQVALPESLANQLKPLHQLKPLPVTTRRKPGRKLRPKV